MSEEIKQRTPGKTEMLSQFKSRIKKFRKNRILQNNQKQYMTRQMKTKYHKNYCYNPDAEWLKKAEEDLLGKEI